MPEASVLDYSRLKARPNNILVRPVKRERKTVQGLVIPYAVDERPQEGEVISVGENIPMDCHPGDIILYLKLGVDDLKNRDQDLLSVPRRWIMGVLRDKHDYMSIQPFNRILVEMIPVTEDYRLMFGMSSFLAIQDKKSHYEPNFRRGKVVALDSHQTNGGEVEIGDVIYMAGHAGITLDGEDVEDQPLYGTRHRWLKFKEVLAKQEENNG